MSEEDTVSEKPPAAQSLHSLYRKPVLIDRAKHAALRVAPIELFDFAAGVQALPVTVNEFKEVQKEYPLVFARTAEKALLPLALLGLRKSENLYVNAKGEWDARYIPAYIRRYPFIFTESAGDKLTLCVDEAFSGLNSEVGEPLFQDAQESAYLKRILEFMGAYQSDFKRTIEFCRHLDELGVLIQMSAQAELKSGEKYVVNNFLMIDEAKLRTIDSVSVGRLFQSGELALVYAHLMSLSNLGRLIDRLALRSAH